MLLAKDLLPRLHYRNLQHLGFLPPGPGTSLLDYPYSSGYQDAPRQGPTSLSPLPKPAAPRLPSTCPGSGTSLLDYPYSSGFRDAPRQGPACSSPLPRLAVPRLPSTCPASGTSMPD